MIRLDTIKKFLSFGVALLLMWGMIFCYTRVTDGFSLREIRSTLPQDPHYLPTALSGEKHAFLEEVLEQPYRYLGKGCQFYAFGSADHRYVIKFFKHKHLRPLTWLERLPIPKCYRPYCAEKIAKRRERAARLLSSCQLAYETLPEETGVLYLHLACVPDFQKQVTLIDKVGLKHRIDLDAYEFVIQKKAITVGEEFARLLEEGKEELIATRLQQLINLVTSRCEKGIRDRDRSFVQNVAFCVGEERAVFVDIGQFYRDDTIKESLEVEQDLKRRLGNLRHWTKQHFPELVSYVDALN